MSSPGPCRKGRWWSSLLTCGCVLLSACGGGADESVEPVSRTALAASSAQPQPPKHRALPYDRKGITVLVVAPHGNGIGVANSDGSVRLLDPTGTREVRVFEAENAAAAVGLSFSGDGRHLVGVGRDSVARVWNVATGARLFTLRGHEHPLRSIAASADGAWIATSGEETRILVWDGVTGRLKRILNGHTDFVNALSMSPNGRLLASGDAAARVLIWEVATGRLLHVLRGHANEVNALAFSADGRLLASAGEDGNVLLWDAAAGHQLPTIPGHRTAVHSIAFAQDGALLAGGAKDGMVLLWDVAARTVPQALPGSNTAVNAVAFDVVSKTRLFIGNEASQVLSFEVP